MSTIKEVSLEYPNCDDGTVIWHKVGRSGVTKITEAFKNGEFAQIKYYQIWEGEFLVSELHHYSTVVYEKEATNE